MRLLSSRGEKAEMTPRCTKVGLKKGPWTAEEDELLANYIRREGEGRWRTLPNKAGWLRCGKSCRLRWMNYLRPSVKRGHITPDEEDLILRLHRLLGNRWSLIARRIPGRTDNEIKNYWNTHLSKKLISRGIDPKTHKPFNPTDANKGSSSQAADTSHSSTTVIIKNDSHKHDDDQDLGNTRGGTSNGDAGEEVMNCWADEAFSSFLNSLINDDMFNNRHLHDEDDLELRK